MDSQLQVFDYHGSAVRTVEKDGEIWFVAKDVCDVLELTNPTEALKALDDDEKSSLRITEGTSPRGGNPNMNIINEGGVYSLVFRSNKPEAKAFSRWVRHEVLPQLRKTGKFSVHDNNPALPSGVLEGARVIFETAGITGNQAALALDRVYRSYTGRSALDIGNIILEAPTKHQLLTPTEIGKHFGLKSHRVNEILAGAGFQHKINGHWEALGRGNDYSIMLDVGKKHGKGTAVRQLKWDSSILDVFKELMKEG